jgi:hypothetical protein
MLQSCYDALKEQTKDTAVFVEQQRHAASVALKSAAEQVSEKNLEGYLSNSIE